MLRTLRNVVSNRPEANDPWQSHKNTDGFPGLGTKQRSKEMGEGGTVSTLDLGKSLKHPEIVEYSPKLNIVGDKANQASCQH